MPVVSTGRRRLIVVDDADELGHVAAMLVAKQLRRKPASVMALPTGQTPIPMYRWLVRMYQAGTVDFSSATVFNLDEFYGIAPDNAGSFAAFLRRRFVSQVNLRPEHVHLLDSSASDPIAESQRHERLIRAAGGLDVAILGIGGNGHIAFNEPGSEFSSRTHLARLTPQTIEASGLFFPNVRETPRSALTMGMATIMEARRIIFLASGPAKATIVARALQGEVTPAVPASVLQRHPRLTVVLDLPAAAALR